MIARKVFLALLFSSCMLWPGVAAAQLSNAGAIAGVAKDTTGAVLPGVTVEVASPALIEKVRTVTTDSGGQYKVVDLRPGTYTVTFSLAGFSTLKREGLELSVGFTAAVNADMKVGGVAETVTVSGATPVVDVQNAKTQTVLSRQVLDAIPSSQSLQSFAALTLGVSQQSLSSQDVGGNQGENVTTFGIHGNRSSDLQLLIDGLRFNSMTGSGTGTVKTIYASTVSTQEVVMETSGMSAEAETGGIQLNYVLKDGGNRFTLYGEGSGTGPGLQSSNLDSALQGRGVQSTPKVKKVYDGGVGVGGPIVKDRLWFYTGHRWWGAENTVAGNYFNLTQHSSVYTPDTSRPAYTKQEDEAHDVRLTWQVTPKQKVTVTHMQQNTCTPCFFDVESSGLLSTILKAPDSVWEFRNTPNFLTSAVWSYPVTSKLLLEARGAFHHNTSHVRRTGGSTDNDWAYYDLAKNLTYNAQALFGLGFFAYGENNPNQFGMGQFTASYVTGSHAFKTGAFLQRGYQINQGSLGPHPVELILTGLPASLAIPGAPGNLNSISEWASPSYTESWLNANVAVFAQDQWTLRKLTINAGVRFDYNNGRNPAQTRPLGVFTPAISFSEQTDVPNWKDISPRLGAAYDVRGNGKTAIKASLGRYVAPQATNIAQAASRANAVSTSTSRTWLDLNSNGIPDCNLTNPGVSVGADLCLPISNPAFGTVQQTTTYDPNFLHGWGKRPYSWQSSITLQHELRPGMALNAGYFRTWYGNFTATWNQAVSPADYDQFCLSSVPANVPGAGGSLCGFYDVKAAAATRIPNNLVTLVQNIPGAGAQTEHYDGMDISVTARFGKGGLLQGGVSTACTVADNCFAANRPDLVTYNLGISGGMSSAFSSNSQVQTTSFCKQTIPWSAQTQFKVSGVYPLPFYGVEVSGSLQNLSGPADLTKTSVSLVQLPGLTNLGRPAGDAGVSTLTFSNLSAPYATLEDRLTQVDVRVSKKFVVGRVRLRPSFDIYNLFNANSVLTLNPTYSLQTLGPFPGRPISVLAGRLFKFGGTIEF